MADFFATSLGDKPNVLDWSSLLAADAPRSPEGWSAPEAFLAVLLSAVTVDGELAALEHEELLALVHRSRALKSLSPVELAELNVKIFNRLREEPEALTAACAAVPEDMRLSLFAHVLDLILADGDVNEDEADFLNPLILRFDLGREDVERISDVLLAKNRY